MAFDNIPGFCCPVPVHQYINLFNDATTARWQRWYTSKPPITALFFLLLTWVLAGKLFLEPYKPDIRTIAADNLFRISHAHVRSVHRVRFYQWLKPTAVQHVCELFLNGISDFWLHTVHWHQVPVVFSGFRNIISVILPHLSRRSSLSSLSIGHEHDNNYKLLNYKILYGRKI